MDQHLERWVCRGVYRCIQDRTIVRKFFRSSEWGKNEKKCDKERKHIVSIREGVPENL